MVHIFISGTKHRFPVEKEALFRIPNCCWNYFLLGIILGLYSQQTIFPEMGCEKKIK